MPMKRTESNSNPYQLRDITVPHPHDVLCGRGASISNFVGNVRWRELIAEKKEEYVQLHKLQRHVLTESIVSAVRQLQPPGRFLQRDPNTGLWFDVGDDKAKEKTSQALREGAPTLRKKLRNASKRGEDIRQPTKGDERGRGDSKSACLKKRRDAASASSERFESPNVARDEKPENLTGLYSLPPTPCGPDLPSIPSRSQSWPTLRPVEQFLPQQQYYSPTSWHSGGIVTNQFHFWHSIPQIPFSRTLQLVHPSRNVDHGTPARNEPATANHHHRTNSDPDKIDDRVNLLECAADILLDATTVGDDEGIPTFSE